MEADVYEWLDLKVRTDKDFYSVRYEPEIFRFHHNKWGIKAYVPDFKLITKRGIYYIEVKGFMDFFDAKKIWLFHRDYPYLKLRVFGSKEHKEVLRRLKAATNNRW